MGIAAGVALLKNFDQLLRKLQSLLRPGPEYAAIDVADTAFLIRQLFRQGVRAELLKRGYGSPDSLDDLVEKIARANRDSAQPLDDLRNLVSKAQETSGPQISTYGPRSPKPSGLPLESQRKTVFIVHGHRPSVIRGIRAALSEIPELDIKILSLERNRGRTLIEKFEQTAHHSHLAIIAATADDYGYAKKPKRTKRPRREQRARQNVIFEWGFFVGRLGRDGVILLYEEGVELPSDLRGIVHISLDPYRKWKKDLVAELRASLLPA